MNQIEIVVKVIPKASSNEIVGWENDCLKIRLKAVPDKGKANQELIRFLADICNVRQSDITILSGLTSRLKRIRITSYKDGLPERMKA